MQAIINFFLKPTPKQFVFISFIYAFIAPVIGVLIAEPITAGISLFFLVGFASLNLFYLQSAIPKDFKNYMNGLNIYNVIFAFLLPANIAYVDIVEDKSQLTELKGTIPTQDYSHISDIEDDDATALVMYDTYLRCDHMDYENCSLTEPFRGEEAVILYQPNTKAGNLVYEIVINDLKVYRFEEQLLKYTTQKEKQQKQLFWTVILFLIPGIWFYWHNRRIIKEMPKLSEERLRQIIDVQYQEGETTLIISMFVMVDIITICVTGFCLMVQEFAFAAVFYIISILTMAMTYWLITSLKNDLPEPQE